ncbi:prephenate dehydrogenase [Sutcliffiella horikoshii]|uniref:prephenate dehydrogenase n=1 Tax=Sutcliffiella horikoshii TaxID=79883 RepID=UPI001CBD5EBE|nr:prephenate dehydrogenase [Sutcliffiella horikoshii]UAL45759.1 prephenate dehydrogenase [Sutcliffiella horikoshii]
MNGKVLVIGLGLIGGSIALAIKKEHPNASIIGYDINTQQAKLAKSLKVIDEFCENYDAEARDADFIVISVPVMQANEVLKHLSGITFTKPQVVITDVGSTKNSITTLAATLFPQENVTFIGGHPMAGSHKSGVIAAKSHLFENAFYVLTPFKEDANPKEVALTKMWLAGTKANFITMSASEHDLVAGVISHFPHVVAAGLVHQAEDMQSTNPFVSRLAAGGFRDITRIASSNPTMWKDILIHNKTTILTLLDQWMEQMEVVRDHLSQDNEAFLLEYFSKAKEFRDGLPVKSKGAIPSFYDLYVDVPDYPGIISEITGILAKEKISITNIRIMETREEIYGVLRLSFQSEDDRQSAEDCLRKHTMYETYIV